MFAHSVAISDPFAYVLRGGKPAHQEEHCRDHRRLQRHGCVSAPIVVDQWQ
jgi:hypothetical protein